MLTKLTKMIWLGGTWVTSSESNNQNTIKVMQVIMEVKFIDRP